MNNAIDARDMIINLEFMKNLNPFIYLYGTHRNISLGDLREKISSNRYDSVHLVGSENFLHFKHFELFHSFLVNPLERHQFITVSDFNINVFDIRYPNKNLIQCRHMINDQLVNRLVARSFYENSSKQSLLLLASNGIKSCLLSFDCKQSIQPCLQHVPFYVDSFKGINKYYAIDSERNYVRGIQILTNGKQCIPYGERYENFFSVAFLLNNGNLYMQDFWTKKSLDHENQSQNYSFNSDKQSYLNRFIYENDSGNPIYLNRNFEAIDKKYIKTILEYIDQKKAVTVSTTNDSDINILICKECSAKTEKAIDNDCSRMNSINFCLCLRSIENDCVEELSLLNIESEITNVLSTKDSKVLDGQVKFRDDDPINFDLIRKNWHGVESNSSKSVRELCRPLTQKLFDVWCEEKAEFENTEEKSH
ncbi:hypothetical protein QR98_0055250 [Sarcoptes scabiei]|uniref:Uncharacterized protein n=1 Tax=Sarcoptes scabiei TaxID=52283 RepID=A0A132A7U7_SARSC|nr:hypothetical protein QR98_0055250 [Sarcoptes scabiei]